MGIAMRGSVPGSGEEGPRRGPGNRPGAPLDRRPGRIAILAVLAASIGSAPALAQDQPRAGSEEEARQLFLEGKERLERGLVSEALESFQASLARVRRASILIMIARCYRRLERPDRALAFYEQYRAAWEEESPGAPTPHQSEVGLQTAHLGRILDMVRRAESLLDGARPVEALMLFQQALRLSPWARIYLGLARAYHRLGQDDQALASVRAALGYWERHRIDWVSRHPGTDPPDREEIGRSIAELRALEKVLPRDAAAGRDTGPSTAPSPGPVQGTARRAGGPPSGPSPAPRSAPAPGRPRDPLWLVLGIGAAVLAASAEATAWVAYGRAGEHFEEEQEYRTFRDLTIAGHVVAGAMAVASGVGFFLYWRSGGPGGPRPAVAAVPVPGGGLASCRIAF